MQNNTAISLQIFDKELAFEHLIAVLQYHLQQQPDRDIVIVLADGEEESGRLTYRQLDVRARAVAAQLLQQSQVSATADKPRALLAFNNGIEFIVAFYACLYAGVCAVPVYPPQHRQTYLQRLDLIAADCQAEFILGMNEYLSNVSSHFAEFPCLSQLKAIAVDSTMAEPCQSVVSAWPQLQATDLAFLQYTSGSTSAPKGVMVSHQNLLHNIRCMQQRFGHTERDVIVSWLPMFHDMGLIGVVLQAICIAATCVVMIPAAFLQKPLRWLYAVSRYGGTSTFAPNFAFDLCADRATAADIAALNLSSWRMALNGAEPIRVQTLERFAATFAAAGFAATTLYPGYGLAEATLFVSGSPKGTGPVLLDVDALSYQQQQVVPVAAGTAGSVRLVSSGQPSDLHQLLIVDPDSHQRLAEGQIGEIWLSSPSVAQGYWQNSEQTREVFQARLADSPTDQHFMRTGDYGFLWQQQLYIAGRIKDVIIIRGANYYPQALEEALQSAVAGCKANGAAAFSVEVTTGLSTEEKLVIVQEVERTWVKKLDVAEVFAKARQVISEQFGLQLYDLVLINPATLAKTSSGKIQRRKVKALYLQQQLAVFARFDHSSPPLALLPVTAAPQLTAEEQALCQMINMVLAAQARVDVTSIVPTQHITSLGLDSLVLVNVTQTLQFMTGVALSTEQLLTASSLLDIARLMIQLRQQGQQQQTTGAEVPVVKKSAAPCALSLNQQQLYLLYEKSPTASAYHVPLCLTGQFDAARVQAALTQLAQQHPALRCRLQADSAAVLSQHFNAPHPVLQVHQLTTDLSVTALHTVILAESRRPFELAGGTLCRFDLWLPAADTAHREQAGFLLLNFHHIVIDMVSMLTLVEQLLGLLSGQLQHLPAPLRDYQDFVRLQASAVDTAAVAFWQQQFSQPFAVLQWPLQQARPAQQQFVGSSLDFAMTPQQSQVLRQFASQQQVTLHTVLLSIYQIFLSKLCYQRDFAIGVLNAGRPAAEYQQVLGYFVQPAVFRASLPAGVSSAVLLQNTQQQMLQIASHQHGALAALLDYPAAETPAGVPPVFQTLFSFYAATALGLTPFRPGAASTPIRAFQQFAVHHLPSPGAQLDLSLLCTEYQQQLCCRFEYNSALFTESEVQQFALWLTDIAQQIVQPATTGVRQIALVAAMKHSRQQARIPSPQQSDAELDQVPVSQQIWHNMQQFAAHSAVHCEGETLSYAQLQQRVQPLLQLLLQQTTAGDVVALASYRSVDMIVAILAILQAGCAYLPLDPDQPVERLQYCLSTARPRLVLTQPATAAVLAHINQLASTPWPELAIQQWPAPGADTAMPRPVTADSAAYVIFTSGSTGQPKGVVNSHAGLANRLGWMARHYQVQASCRILQKTPYTFDVSVWELLLPLLTGGCLVMAKPDGHKDVAYLATLIAEAAVDRVHFVPSMLEIFIDDLSHETTQLAKLGSLQQVFCSGEALSKHLQQRFHQLLPACQLHNLYGPTEAAIDVTAWHCQPQDRFLTVPIGHSISGIELYALDQDGMPVPPGVTAELFISGIGLAQGYINKPALTAERFVPNPFARQSAAEYQRMYQTGDLVRYQPAGLIEYLGRTDNQVKIRGFRIELAEVEARVVQLPAVREAACLVQGQGAAARLLCYVVLHQQDRCGTAELKTALAAVLPAYMVPDLWIPLQSMPLNVNGKLDRKLLPTVHLSSADEVQVAAENADEQFVLDCFAALLQLPATQLGRDSHFFNAGGHSLLAARLVQTLNQQYGCTLRLRDIFQAPTVAAIAQLLLPQPPSDCELVLPASSGPLRQLSSSQQRLWFHYRLEGASGVYNIPLILQLAAPLQLPALQQSVDQLLQQYPLLQALYAASPADARLGVMIPQPALQCLVRHQQVATQAELELALSQAAEQPFVLEQELPIRLHSFELAGHAYLLLCLHHIVADGQTLELVLQALSAGYLRALAGEPAPVTATLGYQSYVEWQQQWLQSQAAVTELAFWRQELADVPLLLDLPYDMARPARQQTSGDSIRFQLEPALSQQLAAVAAAHDVTLYILLLSAFSLLLARYSRQTDLPIGTPVFGRPVAALEQVVGYFANTLVIRQQLSELETVAQVIESTKTRLMAAYDHQLLPFESLVEQLNPQRSLSFSPLFQVMFALEHRDPQPTLFGGQTRILAREHQLAKFDLSLMMEVSDQAGAPHIGGYLEFASSLFSRQTMQQWLEHFQQLLQAICQAQQSQLQVNWRQLALLSTAEQSRACQLGLGPEQAELPTNLLQAFYQSYQQAPAAIAVSDQAGHYSYQQLAAQASRVATQLLQAGIQPQQPILLATSADVSRIVALLAVLMAGACYVPLDPASPAARNQRIARQSQASILLCSADTALPVGLAELELSVLLLPSAAVVSQPQPALTAAQWQQLPGWQLTAAAPVYLMFTSGSTGEPKGTLIPQRGVLRLVTAASFMQLDASTVFLHAAPLAFDASTLEIWGPLLNAGRLVISAETLLSATLLQQLIAAQQINAAWLTSSLFNHLTDQDVHCVSGLQQLLIGGDQVSAAHVARVYQANAQIQLINGYGPTETTTFAACYPIPRTATLAGATVPIGLPIQHTQLYIVDEQLQLVPEGAAGELLIGGAGLALGYLAQPELTAEKFIADPFRAGQQVYRSGDIVRRDRHGVIHFIGRADQQVKLRGFRIELAEISAALLQQPQVQQAAVVVEGAAQDKRLLAYVVLQAGSAQPDALEYCRQLQQQLQQHLPAYQIPAAIQPLAALPLTANGKLDVRALPAVDWSLWLNSEYQPPQTKTEAQLAECWAQLFQLPVSSISRSADFFALGGHSLLVARLSHWVSQHLQKTLSLAAVFATPQLAALAAQLEQQASISTDSIKCLPVSAPLELSYAQQRLLFIEQSAEPTAVYNVPLFLLFEHGVEPLRLQQALQLLLERHQVLRTLYPALGDQQVARLVPLPEDWWQQAALPAGLDPAALLSASEMPADWSRYLQQFASRPFVLTREIPFRLQWLSLADDAGLLLLCFHHIAVDGWSRQLFVKQLLSAYQQQLQFAAQPLQYQHYAHWQRQQQARDLQQLAYWRQQLQGLPPLLELPTDQPRPVWRQYAGDCLPVQLTPALQLQLQQFCRQQGLTPYMVLLAGFWVLLAKHSGEQDIAVGSVVANRQHSALAELVGFFANTLVLRGLLDPAQQVSSLLAQAKTTVLAAQEHQDVPFEKVVEALNPPRSTAYSPLFQVMFSLLQQSEPWPQLSSPALRTLEVPHQLAKFDLSLMLHSQDDQLSGYIEYNSQLFSPRSISRYWQHYHYLLEQMLAQPQCSLASLSLEPQAQLLAVQLAQQPATLTFADETLPQAFMQQAARQPEAIALVCGGQHWRYRTLQQQATHLACHLQQAGVRPGQAVAVYLPRQAALVLSLLAIQLAGGFYVPLDPQYPAQRSRNIMHSAKPVLILTSPQFAAVVAEFSDSPQLLLTDHIWQQPATATAIATALVPAQGVPDLQPAYAIYTSGSTGQPKGILIHQRNLMSMLRWAEASFDWQQRRHILAATSICFDLSVFELFLPLVTGGCLTLVQDVLSLLEPACLRLQDPQAQALCGPVTLINTVPSAMDVLVAAQRLPLSVNTVNLAGEPLSRALVDRIYACGHVDAVYNLYGPSEDTTYSTCYLVPRDPQADNWHDKPLIGQVIANSRGYILDRGGNLLPDGVAGELYLAGEGVAHGYLGQPELSAKVFLPDPFHPSGGRMYRTGDKVRRLPSGMLDYLGRLDHQLKLRGFRIEPGEIEAVAAQVPGVREAVAVVNRVQGEHLVLFVLPAQQTDATGLLQDISQRLADSLPDYMQPAALEICQQFPTLPNGKIDRSALQQTELVSLQPRALVAPVTATEQWLAATWQQLLQQPQIGRHDHFFELGGHSLLATQLVTRIRQHYGVELPLRKIFQHAELQAQAAALELLLTSQQLAVIHSDTDVADMETGTL